MHELLYTSVAVQSMRSADLVSLLGQARTKNAYLNVTGMLVFHDREFMQVLEGNKETVFELYDRISTDERHTSARIFWEGPTQQRAFPEWTMAFQDLGAVDPVRLDGWSDFLENDAPLSSMADEPSTAQNLLVSLRDCLDLPASQHSGVNGTLPREH